MNKYLSIVMIVAVIAIGGIVFLNSKTSKQALTAPVEITKKQEDTVKTKTISRYEDYSAKNLSDAITRTDRIVLFFAALAWCPSCQAADRDFKAHFDKVPKDVTILKINYDTAKELKQKYSIIMQDTFIQVDSQGKEITRWNSGGHGVEALLANAK